MAFSKGSEVAWSDVKKLYTRTNTQREKFGLSKVTVPDHQDEKPVPSHAKHINNAIEDLKETSAGDSGVS